MKKRIISLLILFFIILSVSLASCNNDTTDTSSTGGGAAEQSEESSEQSAPEELLVPHLGKRDLQGFTLTFLAANQDMLYNEAQFAPDELNEEPINDAAYNRNERIKSEYNCEIEVIWHDGSYGSYAERVERDVLSGVDEYNVIMTGVQSLATLSQKHCLYDLKTLENSNLNFEGSWWDHSANESMTICDRLFFATGDITVFDDQATQCIYFNKDMIVNHNLENPYQLVYDNKWTIDKLHEMCRAVAVPDGDGIMNMSGEDTWGYVGAYFDTYKFIISSNCPQIERDQNGDPVIAMTNERNVNAFNKAYDVMSDKSCVALLETYYRWNDYDNNYKLKDHFYNGYALFNCDLIRAVSSENMLGVNFNYGVVPTPKYDENQENYVDGIDPPFFYAVSIPAVPEIDIDKVTFVIEALAYLSEKDLTPVYYELTLKNKRFGANDDDAPKMLDLIFQNRCVDLSTIFNWNDCIQYYNQLLGNNVGVMTFMESKGPAMQAAMNETIALMRDFEN